MSTGTMATLGASIIFSFSQEHNVLFEGLSVRIDGSLNKLRPEVRAGQSSVSISYLILISALFR